MAQFDLCALADVKAWLGRSDENSDALLAALISRTSRQILSWLRRGTVLPHSVTETRDSSGGETLVLREWPVLSVSSLTIGAQTIPPAPSNAACGFLLEPWNGVPPGRAQVLALNGYAFGCAFPGAVNAQNVSLVYRAGYQVSAEVQSVANSAVTVLAPYGAWASDGASRTPTARRLSQ